MKIILSRDNCGSYHLDIPLTDEQSRHFPVPPDTRALLTKLRLGYDTMHLIPTDTKQHHYFRDSFCLFFSEMTGVSLKLGESVTFEVLIKRKEKK